MKNAALLVMDYQNDILKLVENQSAVLLTNTKRMIATARASGVPVIYVQVAFRRGHPEVSERNKAFAGVRQAQRMLMGEPGTAIHPEVAPLPTEAVVIKHRVGAFTETDLFTLLRANNVENLVMAGISTSGVILSTLRVAADHDYRIHVVADACADPDQEVHRVLTQKIFPRQADVITTEAAVKLLEK